MIAIGSAAGAWAPVDPARLVGRNAGLHGFYLGRLLRFDPGLVATALGEVLALSGVSSGASAVLVGGYFGTWHHIADVETSRMSVAGLRGVGEVPVVPTMAAIANAIARKPGSGARRSHTMAAAMTSTASTVCGCTS